MKTKPGRQGAYFRLATGLEIFFRGFGCQGLGFLVVGLGVHASPPFTAGIIPQTDVPQGLNLIITLQPRLLNSKPRSRNPELSGF